MCVSVGYVDEGNIEVDTESILNVSAFCASSITYQATAQNLPLQQNMSGDNHVVPAVFAQLLVSLASNFLCIYKM